MALNCSPKVTGVNIKIECVVEIQCESVRAFIKITLGITCHAKFQASKANSSEEDFNIFLYISKVQTQGTLVRIHFGTWSHYLNKLG